MQRTWYSCKIYSKLGIFPYQASATNRWIARQVLLFDLHGTYPWNKYDHEHESIKHSPEYKHIKRVHHWDHVKEHLLQIAQEHNSNK